MPSVNERQHKFFLWVYYGNKDATEKEKQVAKEFLDADKKAGLFQHLTKKDGKDLPEEEKVAVHKKKVRATDWK